MLFDILFWVIFGLIVGFIANLIDPSPQRGGMLGNILLGVAGAVLAGWITQALNLPAVAGFNLYSLAASVVGALIVLFIYKLVLRRGKN